MAWNTLPTQEQITATISALQANGISAELVQTADEAKAKVQALIPTGVEIMDMTSETLRVTGIADLVNGEPYDSVKKKLGSMNRETGGDQMQKLGAAPEWVIGSVHAVTEDGKVVVVSNTGSQLPAYAYGSQHVVWVIGTQKIVKNLDDAMKRIDEHVLPLESERARIAYGVDGSYVSKVLIFNREINPGRIQVIFVNQVLGY